MIPVSTQSNKHVSKLRKNIYNIWFCKCSVWQFGIRQKEYKSPPFVFSVEFPYKFIPYKKRYRIGVFIFAV